MDKREYGFLKGLYVKYPASIDDLLDEFCRYYAPHLKKEVEFLSDEEW